MGEPYFHDAGQRVFSVKIQGAIVLKDIDLIRDAGFGKALRKSFPVTVTTGHMDIDFVPVVENPLLCAVEIHRLDASRFRRLPRHSPRQQIRAERGVILRLASRTEAPRCYRRR